MILVSACLLGEKCKYNGSDNKNDAVIQFLKGKRYVAVCPEMMGGLPAPRLPSEIVDKKVIQKDGTDVTAFFEAGAKQVADMAEKYNVKLAILKANSPSCGAGSIYDGTFSGTLIAGNGITAEKLLKMGIAVKTEKELEKEVNS
ncbi:MAG: DUF523 domain-containing protein [Clostridia bacterium]|nr:DUF523 domain-containing protein [Clostridia bacterium]